MNELIEQKLAILPDLAGLLFDERPTRNNHLCRESESVEKPGTQLFHRHHDGKTQRLVSEIEDFEYIVTSSNIEALVLELNLIKQYDPKYNIMLKDDKTYPYLKMTAERHPKLIITRQVKKDKGKYFGPYPHAHAAGETKKLLDRLILIGNAIRCLIASVCIIIWVNVSHHVSMKWMRKLIKKWSMILPVF